MQYKVHNGSVLNTDEQYIEGSVAALKEKTL
jgi:hypothetical protein